MSYPLGSSSNGVSSTQSGRYTVAPQAIQSVIADHQHKSAHLNKAPRGSEPVQFQMDIKAAGEAYFSGKISGPEFDAICNRIEDATQAHRRRKADYWTREQAGLTKPGDLFKEFNGWTDEEVEEWLRHRQNREDMERANAERNRSRVLHQSRHGRGH